ncbi:MAG: hypothetical protein IRZ02_09690 [Acidothermus sp.]|nr:hypothetical protein [Acidothermus sp.]MCL6537882.1 hypothetical protein [Acidothermus sp.]
MAALPDRKPFRVLDLGDGWLLDRPPELPEDSRRLAGRVADGGSELAAPPSLASSTHCFFPFGLMVDAAFCDEELKHIL